MSLQPTIIGHQLQILAGPEALASLGTMLTTIPAEWVPPLSYLSAVVGPKWDTIRGTMLVRIIDYAMAGYQLPDIQAACRSLSDPAVQAECQFPDDYLRFFARALVDARRRRVDDEQQREQRERNHRERMYWSSPEGIAEHAKGLAIINEMRARLRMQITGWRNADGKGKEAGGQEKETPGRKADEGEATEKG